MTEYINFSCPCGKIVKKWIPGNDLTFCPHCGGLVDKQVASTKSVSFVEVQRDIDSLNEKYSSILSAYIKYGFLTDSELALKLGFTDPNKVRPRRFELVNKFEDVEEKEKRICTITGKVCKAWGLIIK